MVSVTERDIQELAERIRRLTRGRVKVSPGSVYPALRALARQGLVKRSAGPTPRAAGRPRQDYELTARGRSVRRAQGEAVAALFGAAPDERAVVDVRLMQERIRSCADLSAFALELRRLTRTRTEGRAR